MTGPNLDELGGLDKQRVLHAIKIGGTGDGRMPPELLTGADADAVATYVANVAGRYRPRRPAPRRPVCNLRCILPASTGLFCPGHLLWC